MAASALENMYIDIKDIIIKNWGKKRTNSITKRFRKLSQERVGRKRPQLFIRTMRSE